MITFRPDQVNNKMNQIHGSASKLKRAQSLAEELVNALTHGLGALVSISAVTVLIVLASQENDVWKIVAVSIYGGSLFLMFLASTLFHSIPAGRAKTALNLFDHCAIYLLIAGTYTPFLLVNLRTAMGWTLFAIVWLIALSGIFLKLRYVGRHHRFHVMNYLAMGWIGLILMPQLMTQLPAGAFNLILAGGIVYTVGVVFYVMERLPYAHSVWHCFVIGGSTCHYIAVYRSVLM